MSVSLLSRGPVTAYDYRCDAALGSKPFPEQHQSMSVSYVCSGSFGYRARGKSYELIPGSILIGRSGDEFACTHEHSHGDVCLSFHLRPEIAEEIGDDRSWRVGVLPPLAELMVYGELARAASQRNTHVALEEAALMLADRAVRAASSAAPKTAGARDRKRAVRAAQWIAERCTQEVDLRSAASSVSLTPFYFLRVFKDVLGVTPHQYLVRSRLRLAAHLLVTSEATVTEIALECGFADLANFTRSFSRAAGRPPVAFRNFCKASVFSAR